jgi:hypothetical protein
MDAIKNWYQSKTVWGALIAVAASILHLLGINLGPQDQLELADIAMALTGAIGGLLALYGRLVATAAIGGKAASGGS